MPSCLNFLGLCVHRARHHLARIPGSESSLRKNITFLMVVGALVELKNGSGGQLYIIASDILDRVIESVGEGTRFSIASWKTLAIRQETSSIDILLYLQSENVRRIFYSTACKQWQGSDKGFKNAISGQVFSIAHLCTSYSGRFFTQRTTPKEHNTILHKQCLLC